MVFDRRSPHRVRPARRSGGGPGRVSRWPTADRPLTDLARILVPACAGCDCVDACRSPVRSRYPQRFDPLGATIRRCGRAPAVGVLRRTRVRFCDRDLGWRFASIELLEPGKDRAGGVRRRRPTTAAPCRGDLLQPGRQRHLQESVVSLSDDRVESFEHVPGVQANFTVDEFVECDELLRAHPDVLARTAPSAGSPTSTWCSSTPGPMATRSHRRSSATAGSAGRTAGSRTRQGPIRTPVWSADCTASST